MSSTEVQTFACDVRDEQGFQRVHLQGSLSWDHLDEFLQCLAELEPSAERPVVIDVRDLTFLDVPALDAIVDFWNRSGEGKSGIAVVASGDHLHRVWQVAGMDSITLVRSLDELPWLS